MMNTMRSFASSFISKLLMIFLVITFGVWGVGDILRDSGKNYAARVGGETVTIAAFQQQKAHLARQIEAMGMKDMNMQALQVSVLRQLVQQKLLIATMRDLGLYVNDAVLTEAIKHEPTFQGKDGKFSANQFHAVLENQRMSESSLLQDLRDETSAKFLVASLDMSDVAPPAPVRSLISATALETRDALLVTIPPAAAPASIDDAALQAFYDKNKSVLYVQPESRSLDYAVLKPAQLDALVDKSITDQMLADAAQAQPKASKATLKTMLHGEQRDVVLHSLQGNIDDALAGGASLQDALAKAGVPAQVQNLAEVTDASAKAATDDVTKTVAEQGFQMGEGETSGLVVTPKGTPLIVHVKTVRSSAPQAYDKVAGDVRAHVIDQLRRDAARAKVQEVKTSLNELTGEGKPQPTAAQWQSVLSRFKLNGQPVHNLARPTPDEKSAPQGLPSSLHQAIFEHQLNTLAGPLTLPTGGQMLAIVTDIHHPAPTVEQAKASEKTLKPMTDELNRTVQGQAFTWFAERHPVKINPQIMAKPTGPADADDAP